MPVLARRLLLCLALPLAGAAVAGEPEVGIVIEGHRFTPAEVTAPAGQKLRLIVENRDKTPEEFESYDLNREKVVAPGAKIVVYVGPLKPGRYEFFGDFNPTTARGWLVVQP
jgi:Cupredoxin-like domain